MSNASLSTNSCHLSRRPLILARASSHVTPGLGTIAETGASELLIRDRRTAVCERQSSPLLASSGLGKLDGRS